MVDFVESFADIPGISVGHATDLNNLTGCTVVLCKEGAVGGVDQRGGAPGTRETDLLRPMHLVQEVHGVLLTGGSAFGLGAADGVMRYLEERGIGFDVGVTHVPIVPSAVLFDLAIGSSSTRPDAKMGYAACQEAHNGLIQEGNVGAGTGATVGKIMGRDQAMKSGLGSAALSLGQGLTVGALMAVNSFGDVVDPQTGAILAGARMPGTDRFANTLDTMMGLANTTTKSMPSNTVIGVVATNARLTKEQVNKVAQMAQDGVARTVRPAHTMYDGDTIFALATGKMHADVNLVGAYAAEMVAQAIVRAVRAATKAGGLPACQDLEAKGGFPVL